MFWERSQRSERQDAGGGVGVTVPGRRDVGEAQSLSWGVQGISGCPSEERQCDTKSGRLGGAGIRLRYCIFPFPQTQVK